MHGPWRIPLRRWGAVWSANAGTEAMFDALNVAFDRTEQRSFHCLNLISLSFMKWTPDLGPAA